jgi:hypothetical protein
MEKDITMKQVFLGGLREEYRNAMQFEARDVSLDYDDIVQVALNEEMRRYPVEYGKRENRTRAAKQITTEVVTLAAATTEPTKPTPRQPEHTSLDMAEMVGKCMAAYASNSYQEGYQKGDGGYRGRGRGQPGAGRGGGRNVHLDFVDQETICFVCGEKGHISTTCPKRTGRAAPKAPPASATTQPSYGATSAPGTAPNTTPATEPPPPVPPAPGNE